ncbi:MAG TPA: rhomboid family intramembrane serine protease [Erysipelotrichaceae bacterium]|jgi:GlpG protein|nr:rhomboid family intramembrane serine protease [Erysipelotrichia bacterium]HPX32215.1 rhomboid family intramembrane serine protease [Erysipelotrichaceae bacterium]HQA85019.1 rhomboid family intramembrane serine protease [Erysipelotrichaceae bacterium]
MSIFKKIEYNAPVTLTFSLISLIVLILYYLIGDGFLSFVAMTYKDSLLNPMMYVRLITHIFGHLGWEHFLGNMSYILLLGPMVEEKYGSEKLLVMVLTTALIAGILNNLFFSNIALCGASGIVFMLIVLSSVTSVEKGKLPLTLVLVIVIYLGAEIYNAIMITDSISQFTHIVGGICGSIFGLVSDKNKKV